MNNSIGKYAKEYYKEFYIATIPFLLHMGRRSNELILIHDNNNNYYLQELYTDVISDGIKFGNLETVNKNNTKSIAEKYYVAIRSKITDKPILEAIKGYEDSLHDFSIIIPESTGEYVKPYKINCNYIRYFGKDEADNLIKNLEQKYDFPHGIISLFWQLRDNGFCETLAMDRLFYVMYVLSVEHIPFESSHFCNE